MGFTSVSTTFHVIENEITILIGFIFLGCAGVFVGHPFDTVKVIQNILNFVLHGSRISFRLIIDEKKGKTRQLPGRRHTAPASSPTGGVVGVGALVAGWSFR